MTVTENWANQSVVWSCFRAFLCEESTEFIISLKIVDDNLDVVDVLWRVILPLDVKVLLVQLTNITFNDFLIVGKIQLIEP